MPLFQGFRPVAGTICPSRAAAVVGPSRAPQGMKKGRRPRRRPRLKLSDKAGPDQCPVPGENALFPAQIAGFLAVSRPVPVYPVFLNYVVPVQELLPESYRQLPPNRIALLLDGYDELNSEFAKTFRNKIKQYTQDAPAVNIVISSRSNFCGNESRNESRTFPGFYVYVLEKLDEADLRKYLKSAGIDITLFWKCAYVKGVSDLAFNPFYLLRLASIYAKDNDLPPKNQLMDRLIAETFNVDDQKFSGELDERYVELFSSLELSLIHI